MAASTRGLAPPSAPLQSSPPLHAGVGFFKQKTCARCRSWSYEIYQRTLTGKSYCVACLKAGAGMEEVEALVKSIVI